MQSLDFTGKYQFLLSCSSFTSCLQECHLTSLGSQSYRIGELQQLSTLFFGKNKLKRLPFEITKLDKLENFSSVDNLLPASLTFCAYSKTKCTKALGRIKDFYDSGYLQSIQLLCIRKYCKDTCFLGLLPWEIVRSIAKYMVQYNRKGKKKKKEKNAQRFPGKPRGF